MTRLTAASLLAEVSLVVDRYSYGAGGGEEIRTFAWQRFAVLLVALSILCALYLFHRQKLDRGRALFIVASVSYGLLTCAYLYRDGFERLFWGFGHTPWGLLVTAVGVSASWMMYREARKLHVSPVGSFGTAEAR